MRLSGRKEWTWRITGNRAKETVIAVEAPTRTQKDCPRMELNLNKLTRTWEAQ